MPPRESLPFSLLEKVPRGRWSRSQLLCLQSSWLVCTRWFLASSFDYLVISMHLVILSLLGIVHLEYGIRHGTIECVQTGLDVERGFGRTSTRSFASAEFIVSLARQVDLILLPGLHLFAAKGQWHAPLPESAADEIRRWVCGTVKNRKKKKTLIKTRVFCFLFVSFFLSFFWDGADSMTLVTLNQVSRGHKSKKNPLESLKITRNTFHPKNPLRSFPPFK